MHEYHLENLSQDPVHGYIAFTAGSGCEEVFEQQSDAWVANVTVANGFDNVETEEADVRCWCKVFESCPECFGA